MISIGWNLLHRHLLLHYHLTYHVLNEKLAKPDKIFNFMYIQLHYINILDSHKIVYFPDRVVVKTHKLTEWILKMKCGAGIRSLVRCVWNACAWCALVRYGLNFNRVINIACMDKRKKLRTTLPATAAVVVAAKTTKVRHNTSKSYWVPWICNASLPRRVEK